MQISQFVLYHGSDTDVKLPVCDSGSRYRDFGQCFYTTYDSALDIVLSSDTYHQLVTKPYLQEEGSLFVCELLEKELDSKVNEPN